MKVAWLVLVTVAVTISSGMLLADTWLDRTGGGNHKYRTSEKWLDANHMQVQIHGRWEDVQLMPLADHLCRSGQPLFQRYCDDPHVK